MAKNRPANSQPQDAETVDSIPTEELEELLPGEMPEDEETTSVTTATDAPVVEEAADESATPEGIVGENARKVLEGIDAQSVEMRDVESLPKDARMQRRAIQNAKETLADYDEARVEYIDNTSGKEAKAESYVRKLDETHDDTEGFTHKSNLANVIAQIAELEAERDSLRAVLNAHVDSKLSETDEFWDADTATAKWDEIQILFRMAKQARATAAEAIDTYNKHAKAGTADLGTIDNYIAAVEKPGGGIAKDGRKREANEPSGRAPQVERAEVKLPGSDSFEHVLRKAGDNTVSNPQVVAQKISEHSGVTVTREQIADAWLGVYKMSLADFDKDKVDLDTEFTFNANGQDYVIRLRKKVRAGTLEKLQA